MNNQNGGQPSKKKSIKDPIIERLKILSEFQGVKEHQCFIASITKEKDLKGRIKDIMRVRKNGVTKLSDSIEFEVQRVRRNNRKKNEKRRQQQNAILGEAAAELNLTLAQSPMSIKSEDIGNCGSAAQSPVPPTFGTAQSPRVEEQVYTTMIFLTFFCGILSKFHFSHFCHLCPVMIYCPQTRRNCVPTSG
jgi:hypothetical protein